VSSNGVDHFDWNYPSDWIMLGNSNSSFIQFIAGTTPGEITVQCSDACRDTTMQLSISVTPVVFPEVNISDNKGILVSNLSSEFFNGYTMATHSGANDATFTLLLMVSINCKSRHLPVARQHQMYCS
jgi:hypothetical protein